MSGAPCVASSDCIALGISGDVLRADPIVAPGDNALSCTPSGLFVPTVADQPSEVFAAQVNGTATALIDNGENGVIGPELSLVVSNPSTTRSAKVFGTFLGSSEQVSFPGRDPIDEAIFDWTFYLETRIDAGLWQAVSLNRYCTYNPVTYGQTMHLGYGAQTAYFTGTLAPGGSATLGVRKKLVTVGTPGSGAKGNLDDSGGLDIRALVVTI